MHVQIFKGENLRLELLPNVPSLGMRPDLTFRPVVDDSQPGVLHLDEHCKVQTFRPSLAMEEMATPCWCSSIRMACAFML